MFVLVRALTYSTLFIAFVLVFVPARLLERAGIVRPTELGLVEVLGLVTAAAGAALILWCILTFAFVGRGTPAPFDPPRELVVRGPYRFVRNPMYLGAGLALAGAAIVYRSAAILGYLALFGLVLHAFVVWYEEPTLTRMFGADYTAYRAAVRRWLPRLRRSS